MKYKLTQINTLPSKVLSINIQTILLPIVQSSHINTPLTINIYILP